MVPSALRDLAVLRRQLASLVEALKCQVKVLLAKRKDAEICPACRLTGSEFGQTGELLSRADVFSSLQSGKPDVES